MKKSIPVRILTALGGFVLLALAAGVAAESFFAMPVTAAVGKMLSSGSAVAVLVKLLCMLVLLTLAVSAIVCALPGRKPRQTGSIMQKGENGSFGITVGAIEKMVLACAEKHAEITHTEVAVSEVRDGIVILMNVDQVGGVSIPLSVARLQKQVRQYVHGRTGLDVAEVRVMVDNKSDAHVTSEFEVEDTVMPTAPVRVEEFAQEGSVPAEPIAEQLRQIAEITQQPPQELLFETEEEPQIELPVAVSTPEELDALLPVPEAAPEMNNDDEKPLHQRVFGAEEMPLTVPMPPEMAQEAQQESSEESSAEADAEETEAAPMPQPVEEAEEDWTAPSMQAAAETVLTGDAETPAEMEPVAEASADQTDAQDEELPMM